MRLDLHAPQDVLAVMDRLEQAGFAAWAVGGCVRDALLGRPAQDWDLTTSAPPEEVLRCFPHLHTLTVGIKHGTVTVLTGARAVEITTYRAEGAYGDHRHPDGVRFGVSLEEDLARRDFTVNAMAWHPEKGLVDPYGGQDDLAAGVLRCVGDPASRFDEDALRILRCLRFSAQLGFTVEQKTGQALLARRELLLCVSHERVREELSRLLCGENVPAVLRAWSQVLFTLLPELAPMAGFPQDSPYHCFDVWEHSLHALEAVPGDPLLRWAALLHDCGKPAARTTDETGVGHFYGHQKESARIAEPLLTRLRFANREREVLLKLIRWHDGPLPLSERRARRWLRELGPEDLARLFALMRGDTLAHAPWVIEQRLAEIECAEALVRELIDRNEPLRVTDLAIGGNELAALGVPKGPEMGVLLRELLRRVQEENLPNQRDALIEQVEMIQNEQR